MTGTGVTIDLVHDQSVNFALQHNAVPLVKAVRITNHGQHTLHDLVLTLRMEPDLSAPFLVRIAWIGPGATYNLPAIDLRLRQARLVQVEERQSASLVAELAHEEPVLDQSTAGVPGQEANADVATGAADDHADQEPSERGSHIQERNYNLLARVEADIALLAFNEWSAGTLPEILAAFVQPNHPALLPIVASARDILREQTQSPSLDGYQSKDPARVEAFLTALFEAGRRLQISYVMPPASFESGGQKIRTPDQVMSLRMATCLDLVVVLAALCEHLGLHPVLIVIQGHAFLGVWLAEESFAEATVYDAVRVRKRADIGDLLLLETTALCAGSSMDVKGARHKARERLDDEAQFLFAVDVAAARRSRILPLPSRSAAASFVPVDQEPAPSVVEPSLLPPGVSVSPNEPQGDVPAEPATPLTRLERWKRRLLDLSLRNRLINFLPSKKTVPILCSDPQRLEDLLWEERRFTVLGPVPLDAKEDPRAGADPAAHGELRRQFLASELEAGRLYSGLTSEEVEQRMLELFRTARTSREEGGVDALSLAIGFVRWFESPSSTQPRLAPILLVPVELDRTSVLGGIRLRIADEDARVNVTLLQKLESEFGVSVRGLDVAPEDDRGIDVAELFQRMRRAIKDLKRFEVVPDCALGLFAFAKFLMWRDLEARADQLKQSAVVAHMLEGPGQPFQSDAAPFPEPAELDDTQPAAATFCPLEADSSQQSAIFAAADGRSFVLEGPPGTGKSQTITNLVAHALGVGKRVLFVSEKMAALEVVHRRLQATDLGPFCLELHSNKAHKREVVRQLVEALEIGRQQEPKDFERQALALEELRRQLNVHVRALHEIQRTGFSLWQATTRVIGLRHVPFLELPRAREPLSVDQVDELRRAVGRMVVATADVDPVDGHPWRAVGRGDWTPELPRRVAELLPDLRAAALARSEALAAFAAEAELLDLLHDREGLTRLEAIARHLGHAMATPAALVTDSEFTVRCDRLRHLCQVGRRRDAGSSTLLQHYSERILDLDHDTLRDAFERHRTTFLPIRWFALRSSNAEMKAVARGRLRPIGELISDLALAASTAQDVKTVAAAQADARRWLGRLFRDGAPDWDAVEQAVLWAEGLVSLVAAVAGTDLARAANLRERLSTLCAEPVLLAPGGALRLMVDRVAAAADRFQQVLTSLDVLLQVDQERAFGSGNREVPYLHGVVNTVDGWVDQTRSLSAWCAYQRERQNCVSLGLEPLTTALEDGRIPRLQCIEVFERALHQTWLEHVIAAEARWRSFRGAQHMLLIERFRKLDQEVAKLSAKVVRARLAARLPSASGAAVSGSEVGLLLREAAKKRGHLAPRQLFSRLQTLLPRLKPCLLMSPMSVAQYLDPTIPPFDLVVFDEASQIPVFDAIGALGRGAQAVVVGDSKQLPPTSFFQKVEDESERDDLEVEDLESILDECRAAGLPSRRLIWHYRSRHESLITFSNGRYYENKLLTFPSPDMGRDVRGVRLVAVEHGVYDRGGSHTNRPEAVALVAEVVRRLLDPEESRRSIGIVTFNIQQQKLIEDLLDRAVTEHPEIERHFTTGGDRLFVKNLENVQGDERDVILFSICYGPDAAGRVTMNFGPLNRQGGERRLNVAITRAREELLVFSTLRQDHIDLSRTQAKGVQDLKVFLDYAARGPAAIAEMVTLDPEAEFGSPFERDVAGALEQRGFVLHRQVGSSGYRIDLAVVDPDHEGRYLLGIECDGATYHSAATARDRDRLRELVLRNLGWQLHRIWSTDWWQDRDREVERACEAVANARRARVDRPMRIASKVVVETPAVAVPVVPAGSDPARPAADDAVPPAPDLAALRDDVGRVQALVAAFAPITITDLARRLAEHHGLQRVTARIVEEMQTLVRRSHVHLDAAGVAWRKGQDEAGWSGVREIPGRDFKEVPRVELRNALRRVLAANVALPRDDLAREAAKLFGVSRLGRIVREQMEDALMLLIEGGEAVPDGDQVRLP